MFTGSINAIMMIAGRLFGNGIRAVCTIIPTQYFIVELRSAIVNTESARSIVAGCIAGVGNWRLALPFQIDHFKVGKHNSIDKMSEKLLYINILYSILNAINVYK